MVSLWLVPRGHTMGPRVLLSSWKKFHHPGLWALWAPCVPGLLVSRSIFTYSRLD